MLLIIGWSDQFNGGAIRPAKGLLVYSVVGSGWNPEMFIEDQAGSIYQLS